MTQIVAWCLGFMKWVLEDPSYVTGGEHEYPQELFSAIDLLFLQFLGASCTQRMVSMVSYGRISPNSFLSSILLVVVIIVTVVIVMVILIVVVVAIVGVNHALLFDPLVCKLCWWLPPESEARGAKDALDYVLDCTVKDLCASCFGLCDANDGDDDEREINWK
ncbi:hypothetical protein Tco_0294832 [Tanacetum coccineum]